MWIVQNISREQPTQRPLIYYPVPVALLDMKKPMGVIKNQVPVAIIMMVVQIVMMILLK